MNTLTAQITYFERRWCGDCLIVHFVEVTRAGREICHGEHYIPRDTATHYTRRSGRGFEVIEKDIPANRAAAIADPLELLADYVQDW